MSTALRIDFVSDVSCPWCAVGLGALQQALARVAPAVEATLHFQPFELNPTMPPEGQDITEHLSQKYGSTPAQQAQAREAIRQRGAAVGVTFRPEGRGRIYNTFNAHRLLHWAGEHSPATQLALKQALFHADFAEGLSPADPHVLVAAAQAAGLDGQAARAVLAGDQHADEVREREQFFQRHGIHAVPAVIINQRHLVQGGQPVEVFERVLREIAAQAGQGADAPTHPGEAAPSP